MAFAILLITCHRRWLIFSILMISGMLIARRSTETKFLTEIHNNENKLVERGTYKLLKDFQNNFEYQTMSNKTSANDLQINFENKTNSSILEEKYNDYSYCQLKNVDDYKKIWRGHFLTSEIDSTKIDYLPTKLEDTQMNVAPTIPKKFLIEEKDFCTNRPHLKSIAYIHSSVTNVERRSVTRQTWGSASKYLGIVFVMGIAKNKEEEDIILKESQLYHDIVQGNYTDLYHFLTYKALNGLYWVTKNCAHVQWVLHSDDDTLIDVFKYLNFIQNYTEMTSHPKIFCHIFCNMEVFRDNSSKWYVSMEEFPYKNYPIYCSGCVWFTSMKVIKKLLDAVPLVKYIRIDDVYVTGLVAEKAGITRYNIDLSYYKVENIGKDFGWLQLGNERLQNWEKIK